MKITGAPIEKKVIDDSSYATNKELIMGEHSQEVIGGAMDDVERKNNLMGRTEVTEDELVSDILRYLSPKNPRLWQDEEIKGLIRKFVQERPPKKIVATPDAEENVQPSEEIVDAVKIIEPEKPSEKKPTLVTRGMLTGASRYARRYSEDKKEEGND